MIPFGIQARPARRTARRPALEALESREMLSGDAPGARSHLDLVMIDVISARDEFAIHSGPVERGSTHLAGDSTALLKC